MINTVLFALWFFLPAGIANASPVFANKIPLLKSWRTPLDFGKSYRGSRIFGKNKTWRGLLSGVVIATVVLLLQRWLYSHNIWLQTTFTQINYQTVTLWLGPLLGAGALLGDALESFIKRQAGIESGEMWFPFDQIDYIIGGILLSSLVITLSPAYNVAILLVWFGMHLIASYVGFLLGLKEKPI